MRAAGWRRPARRVSRVQTLRTVGGSPFSSNSHFSDCADFAKKSLVFWVEFRFTDSVGCLNDLIECVGRTCAGLADKRRGKNSQFSMRDIGLAGFSPFFMQCPSFLSHQRQICEGIGHGRSNCQTLLGMERIPSDNHIRTMLDDIEPSSLYPLFDEVLAAVETAGALTRSDERR